MAWGRVDPNTTSEPPRLGKSHELRVVEARLLVCTCGAVLLDVPDEFPTNGPRYVNGVEFAAHQAHAVAHGLHDPGLQLGSPRS